MKAIMLLWVTHTVSARGKNLRFHQMSSPILKGRKYFWLSLNSTNLSWFSSPDSVYTESKPTGGLKNPPGISLLTFCCSNAHAFQLCHIKQHGLHLILDSIVTSSLTFYSLPSITFDSNCPAILGIVFKKGNRPLGTESVFSKEGKNNKSLKIPNTWM